MSEPAPPTTQQSPDRGPATPGRTAQFRLTALVVIALVVGVVLWLALRHSGSSQKGLPASSVTQGQLASLAKTLGHPIFWVGPMAGNTYELSQTSSGTVYIRYLPAGVAVGSTKPYLTVATYPYGGAYKALQTVAKGTGETAFKAPNGGLAVVSSSYPGDVHLAYPGVDYQIEVFDPTPGTATTLVAGGKVTAFGSLTAGSSQAFPPKALTAAGIAALAKSLGHPLYWVGPKKGNTYEVTQTSTGQVYIRYLPPGVKVGASQAYLTVGTYPYNGAFAAIQGLARQGGNTKIQLRNGGLAVVSAGYPKSIHLAFPGSNYEVEVFSPSAATTHQIVASNKVTSIG